MIYVKWLDVYEVVMDQKTELYNELKRINKLYFEQTLPPESYVKLKLQIDLKLETLDKFLRNFDTIETLKGSEINEII